jgi:hypothetical protein
LLSIAAPRGGQPVKYQRKREDNLNGIIG